MIAGVFRSLVLLGWLSGHALAGDIQILDPWVRATPPGATVAAGYLVLHNRGARADRLVSVASTAAAAVEIHQMSMDEGVMRMRRLDAGLPLPAGETTRLMPGGLHLMFIRPTAPFKAGDKISATLHLEHAGAQAVEFTVQSGAEAAHGHH